MTKPFTPVACHRGERCAFPSCCGHGWRAKSHDPADYDAFTVLQREKVHAGMAVHKAAVAVYEDAWRDVDGCPFR